MKTTSKRTGQPPETDQPADLPSSRYGHFSADGTEYVITDPRPPRPWVNVIANPRVGLAVSQTGSGFSWIDNSQLGGRHALAAGPRSRTARASSSTCGTPTTGDVVVALARARLGPPTTASRAVTASATPTFETECARDRGRAGRCSADAARDGRALAGRARQPDRPPAPPRALRRTSSGAAASRPSPRREFAQALPRDLARRRSRRAVFARNHMWEVPSARYGHWNTSFPYVSALRRRPRSSSSAQGDKAAFLGRFGDLAVAAGARRRGHGRPRFGRHEDPIAALRSAVELPPGARRDLGFVLADRRRRTAMPRAFSDALRRTSRSMDAALERVASGLDARLAAHRMETPDPPSTRSPTTGCATRRSPRASGGAAATTSRAARTGSATSSRTRRSG